jgi:hypothetical protein
MKFSKAVQNTSEVCNAYRTGIQALRERDRNRLSFKDTRKISGSMNLDFELRNIYPNSERWDYCIGIIKTNSTDNAVWLEVHPANASEVDIMISKLNWLKDWLNKRAKILLEITIKDNPYIWVSSGSVSFSRSTPQARKLAAKGISFPREHVQF